MRKFTYDDLDITGPQMVLTLKLTSFAWNVWDGRRPVEVGYINPCTMVLIWAELYRNLIKDNRPDGSWKCLPYWHSWVMRMRYFQTKFQRRVQLTPCLQTRFYFPAMLVGHSSDMNTYLALTDGTLFNSTKEEDAKRHVPRGRKRVAYKRGLLGLAYIGFYSVIGPFFNYHRILKEEWLTHNFIIRWELICIPNIWG